jgi:alkylhydroperoxidase family enzyme
MIPPGHGKPWADSRCTIGRQEVIMSARLPYLERDQVPAEIQAVYDGLRKASGRVLNIFKLMAYHAPSLPRFLQWHPTLRQGALDPMLRRLAYVRASQVNRCAY